MVSISYTGIIYPASHINVHTSQKIVIPAIFSNKIIFIAAMHHKSLHGHFNTCGLTNVFIHHPFTESADIKNLSYDS